MSNPANITRNQELVEKRIKDPKKWTWGALARHYKVSRPRAVKIFADNQPTINVYPQKTQKSKKKDLTTVNT